MQHAEFRSRIETALREIVAEDGEGSYLTSFVLITVQAEPDGDRTINYAWSEALKIWEFKGMLHEALDDQIIGEIGKKMRDRD